MPRSSKPAAPEALEKVSITDVAEASGVSVATVSRALSGSGGVSDGTAEHVRRVAGRLDYRPLRVRRRRAAPTRTGGARPGTGNLAIVTLGRASDWLQAPVMASAVNGIRAASDRLGYRLILGEVLDAAAPGALFENREIDGAITFVSSSFDTRAVADALRALRERVPVVWAMGGPLPVDVDHVLPDHHRIGQLAHRYLHDRGCQTVGYVTTLPTFPLMRIRGHAFLDAACDAGHPGRAFVLTPDADLANSYGRHVIAALDAARLVAKMAAADPPLQGLFVSHDQATAGLYPLLTRAGVRPGTDVTIVSCDNEEPRLVGLDPRPASIDIGAEEVGRQAVAQLLRRVEQPDGQPVSIHVPPRLVVPGG